MDDLKKYLEKVLGQRLSFFDYHKLDQGRQQEYFNDAQYIIKNETFLNEINHLISTIVQNTVINAENFEQVQNARTSILILEQFIRNLESIEDPRKETSKDEIYDAI